MCFLDVQVERGGEDAAATGEENTGEADFTLWDSQQTNNNLHERHVAILLALVLKQ